MTAGLGSRLPIEAIDRLAPFVARDSLERMRVLRTPPASWLPAFLGMSATTFAPFVAFRQGRFDAATARGLALIAHEAGHITQAREMGLPLFLIRYAIANVKCGFRHDQHPLEVPMIALQVQVRAALEGNQP